MRPPEELRNLARPEPFRRFSKTSGVPVEFPGTPLDPMPPAANTPLAENHPAALAPAPRTPRVDEEPMLGIPLALTDYDETLDWIDATIAHHRKGYVCVAAVHTVMVCQEDPELRDAVLNADFTVPDGQPLVWAMNALGHNLPSRVYGPALMEQRLRARRHHRRAHVPLRRPQPGRAGPARPEPAPQVPGPADRRRLRAAVPRADAPRRRTRSSTRSTAPARTSCGSGSACRSRRSGWRACATASTRPCSSASAPRSTSTPGWSRRRRTGCSASASSGPTAWLHEPRRLWKRYARYNPLFVLGFARQYLRHRLRRATSLASIRSMDYDVSVIGLGRVGLPLALTFADAGLRVLGVERDPERVAALREGRMPFVEPGADELLARVGDRFDVVGARRRRRARVVDRPDRGDADVLAHRDRHGRHPVGAGRPAAGAGAGASGRAALDDRAGDDRVRRRLPGEAARLRRRRGRLRRARARADRGGSVPGGDRDACRASSAASVPAPAIAPLSLFEVFGAPIVQTTPVQAELAKIWANILRYATFSLPEPADDGLRALRRERLRRHRADQRATIRAAG